MYGKSGFLKGLKKQGRFRNKQNHQKHSETGLTGQKMVENRLSVVENRLLLVDLECLGQNTS